MKINNAMEFYNFVRNNGLINMSPESSATSQCVEEYGKLCACDPPATKNAKLNQCRSSYISFVKKASQFKNVLLSKTPDSSISFCIDGQPITTLNR